jgi:glycosidase
MAPNTPLAIRSLVIYEIFTRSHGPRGTFAEVEADLERIRGMGVDVIWLMPIHPIGKIERKGTLGSPYSITDYREINPEFGMKDDFQRLIGTAHALGLKVMIDVVYNHTAHDSRLVAEHPDWFHQDAHGRPITTVPAWSDVIDFKHPNPALADELIQTLVDWAAFGVDAFRCDVASLIPPAFWSLARERVAAVKPGVLWLAESVHAAFVAERRDAGLVAYSDAELYQAFDVTYDYDIWPLWQAAVTGAAPVARYVEMLRFQDSIYPANYAKLRAVENHDNPRIQALAPTPAQAAAWTAFMAFNKGPFLIYAGLESGAAHTPSLFEREPIAWGDYALQPWITRLAALKKDPALMGGVLAFFAADPAIQAAWQTPSGCLYGIFNVSGASGPIAIPLPDGDYTDLLSDTILPVRGSHITLPPSAAIVRSPALIDQSPFQSVLLNFR